MLTAARSPLHDGARGTSWADDEAGEAGQQREALSLLDDAGPKLSPWRSELAHLRACLHGSLDEPDAALATLADPRAWAMDVLGFPAGTPTPSKKQVTAQFRLKMRSVHPDHGGDQALASTAVFELAEARRILTAEL